MNGNGKRSLRTGVGCITMFALWTLLIQTVGVQPAGETNMPVGFAALNRSFHELTGVHMALYTLTDWLGLIPVCVCAGFACVGLSQLLHRKSLLKVDRDILLLGGYYAAVIACYLLFERFPVNYRPVFIGGVTEASYPSSTALLALSVMPTLTFQVQRRGKHLRTQKAIAVMTAAFTAFMVVGRAVCGVHWLTDIIGSALLSRGLFSLYRAAVSLCGNEK